jgi:hypothetical protein
MRPIHSGTIPFGQTVREIERHNGANTLVRRELTKGHLDLHLLALTCARKS